MTTYDMLILNGLVVTETSISASDIGIVGSKIAKVGPRGSFSEARALRTIDAEGGYVTPGGVDAHVHVQEPPLFGQGSTADDYESGSRSGVCGGTTSMITFAVQKKSEDSVLDTVAATHERARGNCYIDYGFHVIVGNPSVTALSEFRALRDLGVSSLKIYMTYAALQLHDGQILDVLLEARNQGITTMVHAENGQVIDWMTAQLEKQRRFEPKYHASAHPPMAETEATYRAISLAEFVDAPMLIVHVSAPGAALHIRQAQDRGLPVYAETCPQYLFLTAHDLAAPGFEGAKCVCSPPPRASQADCDAIWSGLADGTFTILSSDHCPFRYDDAEHGKKSSVTAEFPLGHFKYIPNGCPGIETRLPLTLSANRISMQRFVQVTAANPAKLYGLYPRKGALIEGESDADVVIWYPEGAMKRFVLTNDMLHHNVDYTPFEGATITQWPRYTLLRGRVVWDRDDGGLLGEKGYGRFLKREQSSLARPRVAGEWVLPL